MEKLIVLSEDGVSQEFPLLEQRISIGRDENNLICLGDKSVSRHHATVLRVFRGFIIEDEGSTNGTRVNGRAITKQFLKQSDLIEIGKYHLRFIEGAPAESGEDDADKTTVIRSPHQSELAAAKAHLASAIESAGAVAPTPVRAAAERSVELSPQAVSETLVEEEVSDGPRVKYLAGEQKGKQLRVDRAFFSVGNPGSDLVLINKRHTGYFLVKVGGDIPPTINGTPIKAGGVELHDGDRIELGELSLEFLL